jgi:PhnB protein
MEFYRGVFGGELTLSTYGEAGAASGADGDKIMHAQLETPSGYTLMASDAPPGTETTTANTNTNMSVSLSGDDQELRGYFEKLSAGGTVTMPLEKQMWGDEFGMCVDQFGVAWLVNVSQPAG